MLLPLPLLLLLVPPQAEPVIPGKVLVWEAPGIYHAQILHRVQETLGVSATIRVRPAFPSGPANRARHEAAGLDRIVVVEVPEGTEARVRAHLEQAPECRSARFDLRSGQLAGESNDPGFSKQWSFEQASNLDMDLPGGWDITVGRKSVTIAVIDTGGLYPFVGTDHEQMTAANPGEIPRNGIDDDRNGFVDDYYGWDFVHNDPVPEYEAGHGVSVAGIVAADGNNGKGVAGVACGCGVIHLKIFDADGQFPASGMFAGELAAAAAIVMAADSPVRVIQCSWTNGFQPSEIINKAIEYAVDRDKVVVFAAGNFNNQKVWPAKLPDVLAVAAVDREGHRSVWGAGFASSYGPWVDFTAGGSEIFTTWPEPYDVGWFFGTSAAAPHVSGAAALLFSKLPGLHARQARRILEESALDLDGRNPGFEGLLGKGFVNSWQALRKIQDVEDLGFGAPAGRSPSPDLVAWRLGALGNRYALKGTGFLPGENVRLVFSTARADRPVAGGLLVPLSDHVVPLKADNRGRISWIFRGGDSLADGTPVYFQVLLEGRPPEVPAGLTNAIQIRMESADLGGKQG
ncbi:MAG: S8 family serine peptidase [Planctomycetota bacterium]